MSNIKQSLEKLGNSIGNLEASLELISESVVQDVPRGHQTDMFSNGVGKAMAQKIDRAIAHVEKMLGETN